MIAPDSAFAIATSLAPPRLRPALVALWALDARLGGIVASTREPLIGQLRLTWWHDALIRLDTEPAAPAEPVLQAIRRDVRPHGVSGRALASMTDGWEVLVLAENVDEVVLTDLAVARGGALFDAAQRICGGGGDDRIGAAGHGWALADLANNIDNRATADIARALAARQFDIAFIGAWPRSMRPIGALALLADLAMRADQPSRPRWRDFVTFLRFRMTGRR